MTGKEEEQGVEINETVGTAKNVASLVVNAQKTLASESALADEKAKISNVIATETGGQPWDAEDTKIAEIAREVRDMVLEDGETEASQADEFWVGACVHARKGDPTRASALLKSLISWRLKLADTDDAKVHSLLRRGLIWSSGKRDRTGRHILHVRIRFHDPSLFTPLHVVKAMALVVEWTLRTYRTARSHGVVILGDASGIGLRNIDPRIPRELVHSFSRTLPVRVGGLCVMNPPWFMRPVLAIVSALLNSKLKSRIRAFGRPEELAPYFDVDVVPVDGNMGGTLHWDMDVHREWAESVIEVAESWPPIVPSVGGVGTEGQ